MNNSVILKSFSGGISVILDDSISFNELLSDIADKFKEADKFFKNAALAISLEGRELSVEEEKIIVNTITENSRINVLCLMGKDENKNIRFTGVHNNLTFQKDENCGQFYRGSLKNSEKIETENSIVILGDVNKGCTVVSQKDVVILGNLYGSVYSGSKENSHHFVVALNMEPEKLVIGNYEYQAPKKGKFSFRKKEISKIAYVTENSVKVEAIDSSLLENFTL